MSRQRNEKGQFIKKPDPIATKQKQAIKRSTRPLNPNQEEFAKLYLGLTDNKDDLKIRANIIQCYAKAYNKQVPDYKKYPNKYSSLSVTASDLLEKLRTDGRLRAVLSDSGVNPENIDSILYSIGLNSDKDGDRIQALKELNTTLGRHGPNIAIATDGKAGIFIQGFKENI